MRLKTTGVWYLSPWVIFFTVVRTLVALWILINPVWGFIWSLIFDFLDARVLLPYVHLDKLRYDLWDKVLDSVTFVTELIVGLMTPWAMLMVILFIYRMIGHTIFWINRKPRVIVFFPNLFETTFFWLLIPPSWYVAWISPMTLLYVLFGTKIAHEIILHWIWPTYIGRQWQKILRRMFRGAPFLATFLSTDYPEGYK